MAWYAEGKDYSFRNHSAERLGKHNILDRESMAITHNILYWYEDRMHILLGRQ